jgi:hypothetical protein
VNVVSEGSAPWVISSGDPAATLEIRLQTQTVILSWHRFVYAEGDSEQLRVAFASHDVVINGQARSAPARDSPAIGLYRFARGCVPNVFPARPAVHP